MKENLTALFIILHPPKLGTRDLLARGFPLTRAISSEGLFLLPISENFHFPPDLSCTDNLRKREALGNGGFGCRVRGGLVLLRNRKFMRARLRLYDRNELLMTIAH